MSESANKTLNEAISACGGGFISVVIFSMVINLLMLTAPIYMLQVFDRVMASRSTDTLLLLTLIAGVAFLTYGALEALRGQVTVRVGNWLDRRLGATVLAGSISTTSKKGTAPSVQGLRDLGTIRGFLSSPGLFPILDAPWAPIFLAVIFMLHPMLGWIALGGAVILFSLAILNEITTREILAAANGASIGALRNAEAAARNADVVEAMGMLPNLVARWERQNSEALMLQAKASDRNGGLSAASKFIRFFLQVAIMGGGAWLVIEGEMTPGSMIAGSILMGRGLAPVEQAISSWRGASAAHEAYLRIRQQLADIPERGDTLELPDPTGALSVETLSYVHPGAAEPTLRGITFKLKEGETLGLIGPSASGKTTLARLLIGNTEPTVGHVRLDGVELSQWAPEEVGRHIGYLPQDVELFSGTISENIARMGDGADEEIIAAAKLAGVHEMILRLPGGYETEIGEGGKALSGGERQRVALARAVYGNPQLVLLDEPNASLDRVGEEALIQAIDALRERGATTIIIAHRPNILNHVDKVLILQDGTVRDFGDRQEVLAKFEQPRGALPEPQQPKS